MGVPAAPLPMLGVGLTHCVHLLMALGRKPKHTHTHIDSPFWNTSTYTQMHGKEHAQNNYLSRDSTQSSWMPGDSRTRTNHLINSPKNQVPSCLRMLSISSTLSPKSFQATQSLHKKSTKAMDFFLILKQTVLIYSDSRFWESTWVFDVSVFLFFFSS